MPLRKVTNRLRETRRAKGFSGFDLQLVTNIPAQEIYKIERGLRRAVAWEKDRLATCLGVAEDELFPNNLGQEIVWY